MQDEFLMRQRDQAYERFEAEWEECLKRFSRAKIADAKPEPIERTYGAQRTEAVPAIMRGLSALVVTLSLFSGGMLVLTAPTPASASPVAVELA